MQNSFLHHGVMNYKCVKSGYSKEKSTMADNDKNNIQTNSNSGEHVCSSNFMQLVYTGKRKNVMAVIKKLLSGRRMDILGPPNIDPYVKLIAGYTNTYFIFIWAMKKIGDALSASLLKVLHLLQKELSEEMTALMGKTLVLLSLLLRSIRESFRCHILSELNILPRRNVKYVQDSAFVFGNVLAKMIVRGECLNGKGQSFVQHLSGWKRMKILSICLRSRWANRENVQQNWKCGWEMFSKSCVAHGIPTKEWKNVCKKVEPTRGNVQVQLPRPLSIENNICNFDRCSELIVECLQTLMMAYSITDAERTTGDILSVGRFVRVAYTILLDIVRMPCSE